MTTDALLRLLIACAMLSACAPAPASSGGSADCNSRSVNARAEIAAVIDAHSACEKDADCQSIPFQSGCFDACTRAVNASGVSAVTDAVTQVNASTCANFEKDGCAVVIPPCAPPTPPACVEHRCQ